MYHMTYLLEYWFYPFSGNPHFTGAGKGGQGGQKNCPPKFSYFIDPKGSPNQKLENKHKNLADDGIFNISTSTNNENLARASVG